MKRIFGLIGFPLGHSFSAQYFARKFDAEKIDAEYRNFEIDDVAKIKDIIASTPSLCGFNVTIPYKQKIIDFLDNISDEAKEIGAVNCVKINENGFLSGYNTDTFGFRKSLIGFIPANIKKALILGNGGAAKAVRYTLKNLQMEVLTVSRTPKNNDEINYSEVADKIADHHLIVNTTPLGTWPNTQNKPDIPYQLLTPKHYLFDLVYNPETTAFMNAGLNVGAHARNGYEMLIGQAEKAWKIWNQ